MESRDTYALRRDHPGYVAAMERNYRWNFTALVIDQSFFGLALTMLSYAIVLPNFVRQLSDRSVYVGLIAAIYSASYFVAQLPGAYLAHGRARRKPIILAVAALERGGIALLALTTGFADRLPTAWVLVVFFLVMAIKSMSEGLISPAYSDFVSKSIPVRRGTYYAVTRVTTGLLGLGSSYVIAQTLSGYPFPQNYSLLFWMGLAVSLISLVAIACFREDPFPETAQKESFRDFFRTIPALLRARGQFRWLILVRIVVNLGMMALPFLSVHAIERFGLGSSAVGRFTLVMTASMMAAAVVSGWLGDRKGFKVVLEISALMGGLASLLVLFFPYLVASYVGFALMSFAVGATLLAEVNLTMELSPPKETARFVGIANTVLAPFVAIGPLIGGLLVDSVSYGAMFVTSALLSAAGCLMSLLILKEPRSVDPD